MKPKILRHLILIEEDFFGTGLTKTGVFGVIRSN
jgi:hypothetical protein